MLVRPKIVRMQSGCGQKWKTIPTAQNLRKLLTTRGGKIIKVGARARSWPRFVGGLPEKESGVDATMKNFKIKTVRCEWQIIEQGVNQHGFPNPGSTKILESFPSHKDAMDNLPKYGKEHPHISSRWHPHQCENEFIELQIRYVEVLINESST